MVISIKPLTFLITIFILIFGSNVKSQDRNFSFLERFSINFDLLYHNKGESVLTVQEIEFIRHNRGLSGSFGFNFLLNPKKNKFKHFIGLGFSFPPFLNVSNSFISRQSGKPVRVNDRDLGLLFPYLKFNEKIAIRKSWFISIVGRCLLIPPGSFSYALSEAIGPGSKPIEIITIESNSSESTFYPEFGLSIGKNLTIRKFNLGFFLGYNYSVFPHLEGKITYNSIDNNKYESNYLMKNSGIILGVVSSFIK